MYAGPEGFRGVSNADGGISARSLSGDETQVVNVDLSSYSGDLTRSALANDGNLILGRVHTDAPDHWVQTWERVGRIALLPGQRGYFVSGQICGYNGCFGNPPDDVRLNARTGERCGTIIFPPIPGSGPLEFTLGSDGTVIERRACSYRWWPRMMR